MVSQRYIVLNCCVTSVGLAKFIYSTVQIKPSNQGYWKINVAPVGT